MEDIIKQPLIIVVDNDYPGSELVIRFLMNQGYQVLQFDNSDDCLKALANEYQAGHIVDCVITKVMSPGSIDGYNLAKIIRKDEQFHNIPLIICSSLVFSDSHVQAAKVGADFLPKPVNLDLLLFKVNMAIELSAYRTNKKML